METVKCDGCGADNSLREDVADCQSCGASLALAKITQSIQQANERMARLRTPVKSFYTFNGFGTTLLDFRRRDDGLHTATRWVVAMMIPLIPLASYVVRLGAEERGYGHESQQFEIVEKNSVSPLRALYVYLLVALAFAPLYFFGYHDYLGLRTLGFKPLLLRGLLPIFWAGFIIFYWLQKK